MRFATYGPRIAGLLEDTEALPRRTAAAWVEPDGSLVNLQAAYGWDCMRRGCVEDPQVMLVYARLDTVVSELQTVGDGSPLEMLRHRWLEALRRGDDDAARCAVSAATVQLQQPLRPRTFRDFYAFEQHVRTCRAKRGQDMMAEWYEFPVFYFSNPDAFRGPDEPVWAPPGCHELDFELEVACVIGTPGVNVAAEDADQHIFGYVILNDWSARDIQRAEVKVGLGPAKGKDFATSIGPYLVTPSELQSVARPGPNGQRHALEMSASVNGRVVSSGRLEDIHYTFAQMIERASIDVPVWPGDVIGSGTVGTGCILELGPDVQPWLRPGDEVRLEVDTLGALTTPIVERRSWNHAFLRELR